MQLIEILRGKNRTLLEMNTGLVFWGLLCQFVGVVFVTNRLIFSFGIWFGIALGAVSILHMYRTLDRALDLGDAASKVIFRGYMVRYVLLVVIFGIIMVTNVINPLVVFLAYMGVKVTALLQPITHKLCNKIFNETDPIPESIPEEVSKEEDTLQK